MESHLTKLRFYTVLILTLAASNLCAKSPLYVLLGPPGAGKTSLSKKLSTDTDRPRVSVNQLLIKRSKDSDEQAQEIKATMKAGQLVSDAALMELLLQRAEMQDCKDGFILVGCPKTMTQAELLSETFSKDYDLIFLNVDVDEETVIKRLEGRRICSDCSKPYHIKSNPPLVMGHCDKCNGLLVARGKDNHDVVKKRLDIYRSQYEPMESFLKDQFVWIELLNNDFDECYQSLITKIDSEDSSALVQATQEPKA